MSTVRHEPLVNGERARKASAIFRRSTIVRGRTGFERLVGLSLLAGSGAGNYLAFNKGAFQPLNSIALVAALAALALLTALQWFYRPTVPSDTWWFVKVVHWMAGLTWKYCAAVIVGVGLTVWGAKGIILPILANILTPLIAPDLLIPVSWLLLVVVSLVVEVIPENILVE